MKLVERTSYKGYIIDTDENGAVYAVKEGSDNRIYLEWPAYYDLDTTELQAAMKIVDDEIAKQI